MNRGVKAVFAWFLVFGFAGCASNSEVIKNGQSSIDASEGLVEVREKLDQARPKAALKLLERWIAKNQDSIWRDRALFLQGQALFDRGLYYQAFEVYEKLLDEYGSSGFFQAALEQQMAIAKAFMSGKKRKVWKFIPVSARTEALEILDRIYQRWPGSELAAEALMLQGDYYYDRGRFIEAQQTYQLIVEHYQRSGFFARALLRNAEATHGQYLGSLYESGCLTDARIRYEQYRARFPEKARQIDVAARIEKIDQQQGQKCLSIADYYTRTGRYDSARYYNDYVAKRWPDAKEQ